MLKYTDVVQEQQDGTVILTTEREAKLRESIKKLEQCTQYALVASRNTWYPCYTCTNGRDSVFLYKGEVWKYGYTCEDDVFSDRYKGKLPAPNLEVLPQFFGTIQECKEAELRKIFNYPLLPENQKRKIEDRLARPAGNNYDA